MKKTLLLILINTFFSLVSSSLFADSWGTTTTLNPYAYDLNSTWDESTQKLTLSFKLNAPAVTSTAYNDNTGIQILAVGENGAKYFMYAVPTAVCQSAGLKTFEIDLSDGKGNTDVELPTNETLTWEVIVRGNNKTLTAPQQLLITKDGSQTGKIKNWRFPTSIAVNNDFNSADFGSIYVAGNAYYDGNTEFQGLTKYDPIFTNMGWYGIYNGNNNMPRRVRVSEDGRIFASSYTTSSPTVWEVSSDLNGWTTRISEASINMGMDLKGSGNNLKVLLYSYKSSDYICNEYTWNGSSFSSGEEVRAIDDGTYAVVSNHHANIRYDNYYNGYWFAGSRSGSSEKQLAHIVAEGDACDVYYTSSDHWGGSGVLSYDKMLVRGHNNEHTTNNPSKLIFYTVSKAANGKVQLDVAYGGAKSVHSACKGRYVNDFAIDRAYNLYVVSTQNNEVSKGDHSTLSETGQLMAFALPYSGATTTPAPKVDAYTFRLDRQQLNPFAYNLYTTQENDGRIALHFFLNANADRVLIRLIDEMGNKYLLRDYPTQDSDKNYVPYNDDGFKTIITKEDIERLKLPLNGTYSWEVEVVNNSVQQPSKVTTSYQFFHPSSVDIDNNPENETFGTIIANEAMHAVKNDAKYATYHSYSTGAGIYAFDAAFLPIYNQSGSAGYNGGNTFELKNPIITSLDTYAPRRIRFSDDGRLFVTSLNPLTPTNQTHNAYLWEITPSRNANKYPDDNILSLRKFDFTTWTPVFQNFTLNSEAELLAGSEFMAGPNTGFDVKGSGENLKLLMLSSSTQGMTTTPITSAFKLHEYNLGTNKTWSQAASRSIDMQNYIINNRGTQIEYDNDGGFWLCQYRVVEQEGEPTLLYFDANGEIKYRENFAFRASGAIRFNHDFSKLIITGVGEAKATIYRVEKNANGEPSLTPEVVIPMTTLGKEINDFAFDYAGNLYACGNSGERLSAWAMPYSGTVITPAAGRFSFKFTAAYQDAQLNPYAYRLKAEVTPKDSLKIFYNINADAERLQVYFTDTHTRQDYLVRDYPSDPTATIYRDTYMDMIREVDVDYFNIPRGVPMDWRVEVHGKSPIKPVKPSLNVIPFYAPNSVAIDTDPESPYFGRVLVVETRHKQHSNADKLWFSSVKDGEVYKNQGGIYAFMPELYQTYWRHPEYTPLWVPWDSTQGTQAYTGNIDFTSKYIHGNNLNNLNTHFFKSGQQPWMVRISDDGRIFVSAMDDRDDNAMVWELSQDLNTWKPLLTSADRISCSMDVKGSGEDLKLLIYSTDKAGMAYENITYANYHLHEYALGNSKTFTGSPTRIEHFGPVHYGLVSYNAKVMYDKGRDGFWFGGGNTGAAGEVYFANAYKNSNGVYDKMAWGTKDGTTYSGGSGVNTHMINGEKILFKGVDNNMLQFFKVTYDNNGAPILEDKGWSFKLSDKTRCRCSDFAVDYANNLYITDGENQQLMTVALPYSGHVATPASSREQIIIPILADERSGVEAAPHVTQVDRAIVYRRLQAGMCNTICLPFAITDKSKTPYANATFYEFTALTQGNDQVELQFNEVQTLEAGKPYLIQPNEDIVDTVRLKHYGEFVNFVTEPKDVSYTLSNGTRITYHGVLAPTTIPQGALMVVANNRLAKASQAGMMQGLRGYFTVNGPAPSKAIISFKPGTTTDDKTVVTPLPSTEVRKVLQDQQVFIIKDNEAYNILGEAVAL